MKDLIIEEVNACETLEELKALEQQLATQEQQLEGEVKALEAEVQTKGDENETIQLIFYRQSFIKELTDYKSTLEYMLKIKDLFQAAEDQADEEEEN